MLNIPKKLQLFFGLLTLGLFVTGIILERNEMIPWKNYSYKFLADCDELDVVIESSYKDHGFLLLNDSIMVWGGHKLIRSTNESLSESLRKRMMNLYGEASKHWEIKFEVVPLPYRLVKFGNDTVFHVIEAQDTLTFTLNNANEPR